MCVYVCVCVFFSFLISILYVNVRNALIKKKLKKKHTHTHTLRDVSPAPVNLVTKGDGEKCKGKYLSSTRNYRILCFYLSNTFVMDS